MVVKKSDKQGKKYVAVFTRDNGRIKRSYFGQAGADDYLKTKNNGHGIDPDTPKT